MPLPEAHIFTICSPLTAASKGGKSSLQQIMFFVSRFSISKGLCIYRKHTSYMFPALDHFEAAAKGGIMCSAWETRGDLLFAETLLAKERALIHARSETRPAQPRRYARDGASPIPWNFYWQCSIHAVSCSVPAPASPAR